MTDEIARLNKRLPPDRSKAPVYKIADSLIKQALMLVFAMGSSMFTFAGAENTALAASKVTWPTPQTSRTPIRGRKTTLTYADGSQVDVVVKTAARAQISLVTWRKYGVAQTKLNYNPLGAIRIFYGGGRRKLRTTVHFSNFRPAPQYKRSFIFVGHINGGSSPITVRSTGGTFKGWRRVGSPFPLASNSRSSISWQPRLGRFVTNAPIGNDSMGIIVDTGKLQQGSAITLTFNQPMNDAVLISLGVEVDTDKACKPNNAAACGCATCGEVMNNCGQAVECGTCNAPAVCGGGGTPNTCGVPPCATCGEAKQYICDRAKEEPQCVSTADAAKHLLEGGLCGPCVDDSEETCKPDNAAACGCASCGEVMNNCGQEVRCGFCNPPAVCGGGGTLNTCGVPPCAPCGEAKQYICVRGDEEADTETQCVSNTDTVTHLLEGGLCGPCIDR